MKIGDEQPEDRGGGEPEILDDLDVLPGSQLADEVRRADQKQSEQNEVVQHLVADRFAEDIDRDEADRPHARPPALHARPGPLRRDAPVT